MGRMYIVIMCLCIFFLKEKAKCNEDQVLAIYGCNATLEWILGETYPQSYAYSIKVFNANGIEIAQKVGMKCRHVIDTSMYCEVRNVSSQQWRFVVVLFNVTQANSGKYKGELKQGTRNKTITKELKIIDKPHIKVTQHPILNEPLSITCTVNGESERLTYHWKLNSEDLNSSERIDARSANLTFKRLTEVDKLSNVSCRVCSEISCCIESETYAPDPYHLSTLSSSPGDNKDLSTAVSNPGDIKVTPDVSSLRRENEGQRLDLYWMGPSIASVFLLIVGLLILVTLRRIHASSQTGQNGSEVSQKKLEMHNRFQTITTVPEHASRPYREHLNSLNNNRCCDKNCCSWTCIVKPSVNWGRCSKLFTKEKKDIKVAIIYDNTAAISHARNSVQRENLVPGLLEDLYSTVDEAAVSIYNYVQDNVIEETSHETGRSSEHKSYHHAISAELHQDGMAGMNETDQTYITPISDLVRTIEICQNDESNQHIAEEKDLHVTNENYITSINDFPSINQIYQAEDTDLHGTDPNYITPINDRADPVEVCPVVETDTYDKGKRRASSI